LVKEDKIKTMKVKELRKLIKEVLNEMGENQVVDVQATLRALQAAVKSGSEVIIDDEEVFKMPMINLVTFVNGGRLKIPMDGEALEMVASSILVDGTPLELIYKDAPVIPPISKTPSAGNTSRWTDPESIFYRGGD
jgi:hypothetical protein